MFKIVSLYLVILMFVVTPTSTSIRVSCHTYKNIQICGIEIIYIRYTNWYIKKLEHDPFINLVVINIWEKKPGGLTSFTGNINTNVKITF